MIYYFSGTHNSRYAALRLGSMTGEDVRFIPDINPYEETLDAEKNKSLGFVFPVYAWGVPPIVMDFIKRLPEKTVSYVKDNDIKIWCVATCGDETGMAVRMLGKGLENRGLTLCAAWSLVMPNVYVLLPGFGTDPKQTEEEKLSNSFRRLHHIADCIKSRQWEEDVHLGPLPRLKTSVVYPLFKKWGVNTKKWHYTDTCIGCGKCASTCPVGNIVMTDGHPRWGNDCTSCCACYHICPANSAQYGKITSGMGQYFNNLAC